MWPVIGLVVIACAVWVVVPWAAGRRRQALVEQELAELLGGLAGSLGGGVGLGRALRDAAADVRGPLAEQLGHSLTRLDVGQAPAAVIAALGERMGLAPLRLLGRVAPLVVAAGGDLGALALGLEASYRTDLEHRRRLRSATAQGRMQAIVVAILPPVALTGMAWLAPDAVAPLWNTVAGRLMLLVAVLLEGIGLFWISRIMSVETIA